MQSAMASVFPADGLVRPVSLQKPESILRLQRNQGLELTSYPNPFSGTATVEFVVAADEQKVMLNLYNVAGMKTRSLYQGSAKANQLYRFELNSQDLAPGVYFIHLVSPLKTVNRKIIFSGN
jgi:hypothetical protein